MNSKDWRPLSEPERAVLDKLVGLPFEGRDQAIAQLDGCWVRRSCPGHCPSIEFKVADNLPRIPSNVPGPMNVEGRGINPADGVPFDVILFHQEGRLAELEFAVYGEPMNEIPDVASIEFFQRDQSK